MKKAKSGFRCSLPNWFFSISIVWLKMESCQFKHDERESTKNVEKIVRVLEKITISCTFSLSPPSKLLIGVARLTLHLIKVFIEATVE